MIGKTFSHYKILKKLGEGGMGVVYKAEDTKLQRPVAIKFLPSDITHDKNAKERFIHEARAASSIDHLNICTIYEIGEMEDGRMFMVMPCYEGQILKEKIEKPPCGPSRGADGDQGWCSSPLPLSEAVDIAAQTAQGLQKAHEKGIVHRDIKPANIFITKDGIVKVLDFGLAKLAGKAKLTKTDSTLGTVQYMSPEQARGAEVDHRTDIWSLGVVLYEMIAGRPPFKGEYDQAVVYGILNEDLEPLTAIRTGVPMDLERIVNKAMAKNPGERYRHADELLVDLKKVKPTNEQSAVKAAPKSKSGRILYMILGIVIAALMCGTFWRFLQKKSEHLQKRKFIAVLPFHPITKSEEDRSFADGIHDDILTQLSKISELKVIARTSVMRYMDTQKSIKEIARELGVETVLEGSTRRSGNTIRVTAQLIDARTEEHLWADTYDRPYADIFAIQSDVAQKIASALETRLAQEELRSISAQPTKNLEAYECFQKGKYFWDVSYNYEDNLKAAAMFEKACLLDTTFALAYAWQSMAYSATASLTPSTVEWDGFVRKCESALFKAEKIMPELPDVYLARAYYFINIKNDLRTALKEVEIANAKMPNHASILYPLSLFKSMMGDGEGALSIAEKLCRLDPKGTQGPYLAATIECGLFRYSEAEKWSDIMIVNNPESGEGYGAKLRIVLMGFGDLKRAEDILKSANTLVTRKTYDIIYHDYMIHLYKRDYNRALLPLAAWNYPDRFLLRAAALKLLNRNDEAKVNFDSARITYSEKLNQQQFKYGGAQLSLAVAYAGLGDKIKALQEMSKAETTPLGWQGVEVAYFYILTGDTKTAVLKLETFIDKPFKLGLATLRLDPRLDPLRGDPRFKKVLEKAETRRKN